MNAGTVVGIVFGCFGFLFLLWILAGFIAFFASLRKGGFASKIINGKFLKEIESYKIDHAWWDKLKTEKLILEEAGEKLAGFIIKNTSNKIAITVHGIYGFHKDLSPQAKLLYENGFSILAPDLRAHGETSGKYISMGYFEKNDIVLWVNKLVEIFGKDCQIVLLGISMGAATVLMAGGEELPKNVKCIVADSGYKNAYCEMKYVVKKRGHVPPILILPVANFLAKKIIKFDLKNASPISAVRKTSLPIIFFHGTEDNFVPSFMSKDMFEASDSTKCELFLMEGAGHIKSFATNEVLYSKKLLNFVSKWVN